MRIEKFTGHSISEATEQMKARLGPDAVILAQRRVKRGGTFSFLTRDLYEITAAVDEPSTAASAYSRHGAPPARRRKGASTVEDLEEVARQFQESGARGRPPSLERQFGMEALRCEMEDVKGTLKDIVEQLRYARMPSLPDHLRDAYQTLVGQDVSEELATGIIQQALAALGPDGITNRELVDGQILRAMADMLQTPRAGRARRRKTSIIAVVGPTGVGKTTTIAKLAAIEKLVNRKDVGLISADTYRIGAIEQLRTFAAIADIPMEVAYKPADVTAALRRYRGKDIVFLDTVGRSQRSRKDLLQLGRFIAAADPDEVHLVVSASTGMRTALDIIKEFRVLKPTRLLFSKLDEAASLGSLLTIASSQRLPLSYLTTGQAVPDDIMVLEPERFASMVYHGEVAHA
jgi:flagellar biosynthesis protein FlhF